MFHLENHPNIAGRRPDLDPNQKGLLVNKRESIRKKEAGDRFEQSLSKRMASSIEKSILLNNLYFESGQFVKELELYESIQIDHILITEKGVFCIEDKYLDDDKYIKISGGALAKKWVLKTINNINNTDTNGLKQNYRHLLFLKELFSFNGISVPIYQMTVLGGITEEKIMVQQFINANLVHEDELLDRIKYIINKGNAKINMQEVYLIIDKWRCKDPDIDKQHIVYARHINDKRLPKRCKKVLRT
ncbi:MAG: NERD domain-containing protein [Lachnospiraceae bacterium]|nr:NERD domain-containing protein [Lachnospiraceae bacterium]